MIIHGRNLIIKVGGTAIGAARSCDIDVSCSLIEVTKPNATSAEAKARHYITDRTGWTVTASGFLEGLSTALLSVGTTVTLTCEVSGSNPSDTVSGSAIVQQCRATGTVGQLSQCSFVFQGTGPLSNS